MLESRTDAAPCHRVELNVIDTGCGIADELREEIFEAFHQADGSMTRKHGGLGMGLSLAKSLATKMSGELELVNASTKGSHFRFELPLLVESINPVKVTTQPKSTVAQPLLRDAKGKYVMIFEDNPVNQKVLNNLVETWGCKTFLAENGQMAVEILETKQVDLVSMDCQMPVMDGFEATRRIRNMLNGNQRVPIMAVTANAMSADEARCYEAGMNGFLPKPINRQIIDRCLNRWLIAEADE